MFDIQTYPELTHYLITQPAGDILRPPPAAPAEGQFYFLDNKMQQWQGGAWLVNDTEWRFLPKSEFAPIGKTYPTQAEINSWLATRSEPLLDKFVYLNGSDDPKAGAVAIWYVNFAGWADEIRRSPSNGGSTPPVPTTAPVPAAQPAIPSIPPCVITAADSETGAPVYINGMPSAILYDKQELAVIAVPPGKLIDCIDDPEGLVAVVVDPHSGIVSLGYDLKIDRAQIKVRFKQSRPRPIAQNGHAGIGKARHKLAVKFPRPFPETGGTLTVNVTAQFNYDARMNPEYTKRQVILDGSPSNVAFNVLISGDMNPLDSFHWQALWLPLD